MRRTVFDRSRRLATGFDDNNMEVREIHDCFQYFRFETRSSSHVFITGIEDQLLDEFIALGVAPEKLNRVCNSRVVFSHYPELMVDPSLAVQIVQRGGFCLVVTR
jgi:hypothetical protein